MNKKESMFKNRILVINLNIVILMTYVLFLLDAQAKTYQPLNIPLNTWKTYYGIQYDENKHSWHADAGQVEVSGKTVDLLYGPYVSIPKGFYTIEIDYQCDHDQSILPYTNKKNAGSIKSSSINLYRLLNHVTCDMRLTQDIDNFELVLKYNGHGAITISNITITPNANAARRGLLWVLLLLAIADIVLVCRTRSSEDIAFVVCVAGITLLASLPLFSRGIYDGHDLRFHILRIEGICQEMEYGHFPVRISSLWGCGYGYPASIYYGDALLYPIIWLRKSGLTIVEAYKVFVFSVNLLSTIIAAGCFSKMFRSRKTGLILALIFITAPYRLLDIYIQAAVGEYLAFMFIPLIAYALWEIYAGNNNGRKKNLFNGVIFALGMTGIITCHVLSAYITVVIILFVILLQLRKTFTRDSLRTYFFAVLITIALSAFFIVPFLDYYRNVSVRVTAAIKDTPMQIQTSGLYLSDLFAFFRNPFGYSGDMLVTPGIVLMVALFFALVLWAGGKASCRVKILSGLSVFILWLTTNAFPWNTLAEHSKVFNLIAQVQFPWRFLVFAISVQVILFGCLLEDSMSGSAAAGFDARKAVTWAVICSLVMTLFFTSQYLDSTDKCESQDTANISLYAYMNGEYLRVTEDGKNQVNSNAFISRFDSDHAQVKVQSRKGTAFDIVCRTGDEPATVLAPITNYKGYVVYDDLGNMYKVEDGHNFMVSFQIPAQFDRVLHIRFEEPFYWTYAFYLSCLTAALVLLYLVIHFMPDNERIRPVPQVR